MVPTDFLQEVFGPLSHHSDGNGSLSSMLFEIGFENLLYIPESKMLVRFVNYNRRWMP